MTLYGRPKLAQRNGSTSANIRHSQSHLLLAELSGNQLLRRMVVQLQTLTCLAIMLYADNEDVCSRDEHLHRSTQSPQEMAQQQHRKCTSI